MSETDLVTPPTMPLISVVLCTFNPRRDVLDRVLDSLANQTLGRDAYELVVVDNNSNPPLSAGDLDRGRGLPLRVVRELRQGLGFSRWCGAEAARGDLLVFVDDDNILDVEYLETAARIARTGPSIGAFGGITRGEVEGGPYPQWKQNLYGFLGVRDYGAEPITNTEDRWGEWEPIGAGMVLRRECWRKCVEILSQSADALRLDRAGTGSLLSAGDSLMARCSYRCGLACSYQPELKLTHFIKKSRLKTTYLARILYGHGRSAVILASVLGLPPETVGFSVTMSRLKFRLQTKGWSGFIWWCWDLGFYVEARARGLLPGASPVGPVGGADGDAAAKADPALPTRDDHLQPMSHHHPSS